MEHKQLKDTMPRKQPSQSHHRCHDCANANLIQWTGDPLIARCRINGLRMVASTVTTCQDFKPRHGEPKVEHRKKRLALTDIYI